MATGAVALLCSNKYRTAAFTFVALIAYTIPADAFTLAFVAAPRPTAFESAYVLTASGLLTIAITPFTLSSACGGKLVRNL